MALQNIEANITLDLYNHDTTPTTIKAIQLDSETRYVAARLQNMGTQYDVDSGATVQLTVIRPDKVGVQISGTTFTYGDEGAQFLGPYAELTLVALAVSGKLLGQFKITSGTQILRTEIFMISAGVALDASTDEWAGEYDGYNLDELVEKVDAAVEKVDGMEADVTELKSGFSDLYNTAYVTDSASGSIAHITDGADSIPMKSLKVNIVPVQSGSGDPSPSNVRAISGWDNVKVTRAGKNVLKSPTVSTSEHNGITFTYLADGGIECNGTSTGIAYSATQDKFRLPVGQYIKNAQDSNGIGVIVQAKTTPNWTIVQGGGVSGRTVTIKAEDTVYDLAVRVRIPSGVTLTNYVYYPMLRRIDDTDDTYEPYYGTTYDISLASAGTVYGGTLDVVSGELTVDKKMVTFDGSTTFNSITMYNNIFYTNITDNVEAETVDLLTNMGFSPTDYSYLHMIASAPSICLHNTNQKRFYICTEHTSVEDLKTWLASNPLQVVYPLATPLTYQLSATEIKSLLGINNVWSDAGDMDVEYRADTKLYIDKKLGV